MERSVNKNENKTDEKEKMDLGNVISEDEIPNEIENENLMEMPTLHAHRQISDWENKNIEKPLK